MFEKKNYKKITNNFTDLTKIDFDSEEYYSCEFSSAIHAYKSLYLNDYNYNEYKINNYESVFLIEDSVIVYFYLSKYKIYSEILGKDVINVRTVAKELTINNLYKFSKKEFWKNCVHPMTDINFHIIYSEFTGNLEDIYYYPYYKYDQTSSFNVYEYISDCLPELNINQRIERWEGWEVHFIIYELNYKNKTGYAIERTMENNPSNYARKREKQLEKMSFRYLGIDNMIPLNAEKDFENRIRKIYTDCTGVGNMLIHKNFCELAEEIEDYSIINSEEVDKTINGRKVLFSGKLNYWIETKTIRDLTNIMIVERELLDEVISRNNNEIEKMRFKLSEYKWKSEDLMVECIKKIFPNHNIIRQHKPYFLQSEKGQMSYDAFVSGLNIAFEYQGKQHFEPIDFFGGKESFDKQHARDLLKMELSKKNKIKLIYINYNEDISIDLIREKLKEKGILT